MDSNIETCLDEIFFGRTEKTSCSQRKSRLKQPQPPSSAVGGGHATFVSTPNPTAERPSKGTTSSWIDNSFMPKTSAESTFRRSASSSSAVVSQKPVTKKCSGSSMEFDEANQLLGSLDCCSNYKRLSSKRQSGDLKHPNHADCDKNSCACDCKRQKYNEEKPSCLDTSFNDSASFLHSIDLDMLDAFVSKAVEDKNSSAETVISIATRDTKSDVCHATKTAETVAKQSGKEPAVMHLLEENDVIAKRNMAGQMQNISKQSWSSGEMVLRESKSSRDLNILQVIDNSKCAKTETGVDRPCVTDNSISVDTETSADRVCLQPAESVQSPSVAAGSDANKRTSFFASRIRKTLAANAKLDTPIRIRHPLTSSDETILSDIESDFRHEMKCTTYPQETFYGLPLKVQELLKEHRSISELYDWQKECLSLRAISDGSNLIYSLPTSGGKTLVAEMLILRQLLCHKKDALLILPFVAIVQEKVRGLSPFAIELDFVVEEYAASKWSIPPRKRRTRRSLYVATIEKASSVINSLIEDKRIDAIGLVVVDELHMLGEGGSRGAILETTLTKVMHCNADTQIIGMSATLSNIKDLQTFLAAEVYSSNFRPVELKEYVKVSDTIYEIDGTALDPNECFKFSRVTVFKYDQEMRTADPDHLAGLVLEIIPKNSCLVFCPTKKNCENVAKLLCKMFPKDICEVKARERRLLYETLKLEGGGLVCPVLRSTIPFGVAYHHSGLTGDERKSIEEAYLEGTLCVLVCTSTLAAGVNLPARRVILRSPYVGRSFISKSQYKQMTGRAGRAGIDSAGESIVIVDPKDKQRLPDLVSGPCDRCTSSLLYDGSKGIRALLLSTIGLQITQTFADLLAFVKRTLCYVQSKSLDVDIVEATQKALQQLTEAGLVRLRKPKVNSEEKESDSNMVLEVTDLGRAVFKGSIDVDYGKKLFTDLSSAQQSIVLANYLHLLYLVTPYDMIDLTQQPHWMTYLRELGNLDASELKVASLVGVSEGYIAKKAAGQTSRQPVDNFAVSRFYLTLMLYSLWKQRTIWDVSSQFQMTRGFIQQLLTGAASFGTCVSYFCKEIQEFWGYQDLLTNFVKKLAFCSTMELIPLLEIPGVKMGRARQLYRSGFRSIQHLAYGDPEELVRKIEHMPRRLAKQIVSSAQMLLTEKAEALMEEADDLIAVPVVEPSTTSTDLQVKS